MPGLDIAALALPWQQCGPRQAERRRSRHPRVHIGGSRGRTVRHRASCGSESARTNSPTSSGRSTLIGPPLAETPDHHFGDRSCSTTRWNKLGSDIARPFPTCWHVVEIEIRGVFDLERLW